MIELGAYSERDGFGGQPPFLWKDFFNLLGFFEKKVPKPLKFSVKTKNSTFLAPQKIMNTFLERAN
jgi:hypothetical protein